MCSGWGQTAPPGGEAVALGGNASTVGVDISKRSIKIAAVRPGRKPQLLYAQVFATPEGAIEGGMVVAPHAVVTALRQVVSAAKLRGSRAVDRDGRPQRPDPQPHVSADAGGGTEGGRQVGGRAAPSPQDRGRRGRCAGRPGGQDRAAAASGRPDGRRPRAGSAGLLPNHDAGRPGGGRDRGDRPGAGAHARRHAAAYRGDRRRCREHRTGDRAERSAADLPEHSCGEHAPVRVGPRDAVGGRRGRRPDPPESAGGPVAVGGLLPGPDAGAVRRPRGAEWRRGASDPGWPR